MERKGIDVSRWQGNIQWNRVRQDGVEFAIIRAAAGLTPDPNFKQNIEGALAVGISVGLYLYSYAVTPEQAKKEAEFLVRLAGEHRIAYPLVLDVEDQVQEPLSNAERTELVRAFAQVVQAAGFQPMLYASKHWLETRFEPNLPENVEIWVAQWGPQNTYKGKCGIWQYSNVGKVNGIAGNVDLNCAYADYAASSAQSCVWEYRKEGWYFGNLKSCWKKLDGRWYWFDEDGRAAEGIRCIRGNWYAFAEKTIGPLKQCQCLFTDDTGQLRAASNRGG